MTSAQATSEPSSLSRVGSVVVLCFIAVLAYSIVPRAHLAEFDPDEGLNLMKALLTYKGFHLYREIWSDQPPMLTRLLSFWSGSAGFSLESGRMLIFCFATLLLWTLYLVIRRDRGVLAALIGVVFLLVSAGFLQAAGAVMIGLPAISLALLSVYFAVSFSVERSSIFFLFASAMALAVSVLTKVFVVVYAPAIFLIITFCSSHESKSIRFDFRACLLWLGGFGVSFLVLAFLLEPALIRHLWSQLILPHQLGSGHPDSESRALIPLMLRHDKALLLLAGAGVVLGTFQRRYDFLLPLLCFFGAAIFLIFHHPLWWHHYLLVSVPVCWLAALGVHGAYMELERAVEKRKPRVALVILSVLLTAGLIRFGWKLPQRVHDIHLRISANKRALENEIVLEMNRYAPWTRWVVSDRPIYPLILGKPVPPNLAVSSSKRMRAGLLSGDDFRDAIEEYKPEQVVLSRFQHLKEELNPYLLKRYRLAVHAGETSLYIRRDVQGE